MTGKPLALGGSHGRLEATGQGLTLVTLDALARLGNQPARCTRRHPGVRQRRRCRRGQAARTAGLTIVAVGDFRGAVFRPAGLGSTALLAHRTQDGQRGDLPGTETLRPDEVLAVDCDVLVPAALDEAPSRAPSRPRCARA